MPLITQAGIGSGLDLEAIIQASVQAESAPKLQAFQRRQDSLKVELSAIGEVKSAISKLKDTIEKLADPENFGKRVANIKQPTSGDIISVTPTSDISVGEFDIAVTQLAKGSRLNSTDGAFSATTDVVTASGGTLTFDAGAGNNFTLTLGAGATLAELRDAINSSETNFGVTANIVNTGDPLVGSKLVLTSNVSGNGNGLTVTSDTAELDSVSTSPFAGGTAGMTETQAAQDAIITVDGLTVNSSTNTFKDAVQDMTIKALKESEDDGTGNPETATLNVEYDRESVTKLVDQLVETYNNLIGNIGFQTRIGKPLNGDATMRGLRDQLINTLGREITGAGPFKSIFDIGLTVDNDGYLEKSSLVRSLNEAMDENFDDIGKAFAGDNGVAKDLDALLANYIDSGGIVKQRETTLNGQLDELEDDVDSFQYRMESFEEGLRKKYAGLDVLLAQMQSTQSYLGAQLASLPGFTKSKS
ncbi:flagellar filament capping protein FliD [Pseudoalteromonas sp. JBTF-M23]|uniref:Flagellar hook-associated protein 2 n=1 Tax=Pseudoalteromonas caenipelagi TaxID=2726988 RepID=A0A849VGD6_9GAMM|nr:flagellar filament capping protein FliD [Pseudoalteromonas caenipelagi]NOU50777.1 flagellar filament capping protein FliD [Pseudoalteromonas caenipelagi]